MIKYRLLVLFFAMVGMSSTTLASKRDPAMILVVEQGPQLSPEEKQWMKVVAEADKLRKAHDLQRASSAYEASVAVGRRLLQTEPSDPILKGELAYSLFRYGESEAHLDARKAQVALMESISLRRDTLRERPGNFKVEGMLLDSISMTADVEFGQKNYSGAIRLWSDAMQVIAAEDNSSSDAMVLRKTLMLNGIALANRHLNSYAAAYNAFKARVTQLRILAGRTKTKDASLQLAGGLSDASYLAILSRNFASALDMANEAAALEPDQVWMRINKAHGLMLTGKEKEAEAIYMQNRGKVAQGKTRWEDAVKGDFMEMQAAGIDNPLITKVIKDFSSKSN